MKDNQTSDRSLRSRSHQTRLNITEIAVPAAAAAPAAGAAAAAEAPAEEEAPKEKTIFTLKLEKIDAAAKAKIIREVKALMPNMNLVEVSPSPERRAPNAEGARREAIHGRATREGRDWNRGCRGLPGCITDGSDGLRLRES